MALHSINIQTVSTTNTFIIAMMIYPEIQRTVQKELDAVLSGDRLPLFEDQDSTPYLVAALKECLRWKSVAPLGLPHSSNRNDEYNGKFIPKDTMLLANIWKFGQDPVEYPLPTEFNPERFLVSEQGKWNLKQDFLDPEDFAFGFGRR
ncbi:cytochrome P450 [Sistotremastrum niveocremeum HHB9708]|uniref:Cytochrome P450 n=1 Tax=Sistotremastrum niveocremeum HHB9708 TaxID=1314777 RepID=A0A164VB90_9AGAM|nr:cytochrome P450 [Sistotremastrum niveocremeum HHB9708]